MNQEILNLTNLYFNSFIKKDIDTLKSLYSDDVVLIDWTGQWYGIDSVLLANKNLFTIDYELAVIETNIINSTTYNSIVIRFDDGPVDILDVLYFDEINKIKKIRAYKG
jgi:hypothetical protein